MLCDKNLSEFLAAKAASSLTTLSSVQLRPLGPGATMLLASVALSAVCAVVVLVAVVAMCVKQKDIGGKEASSAPHVDNDAALEDTNTSMLANPLHRKSMGKGLGRQWSIHGVHEPRPELDPSSLDSVDSFEAYSSRPK